MTPSQLQPPPRETRTEQRAEGAPGARRVRILVTKRDKSARPAPWQSERLAAWAEWIKVRAHENWTGWATSFSIHAVLFTILALIFFPQRELEYSDSLEAEFGNGFEVVPLEGVPFEAKQDPEEILELASAPFALQSQTEEPLAPADEIEIDPVTPPTLPSGGVGPQVAVANAPNVASEVEKPMRPNKSTKSNKASKSSKPGEKVDVDAQLEGSLNGRGKEMRAKLAMAGGGTPESEDAVERGLRWLARHQQSDGSWSFQHGPDDPGLLPCPPGATGLALLAFLGAGYTPEEGPYQTHVRRGLKYLVDNMDSSGWVKGTGQATMYVQGICAIALCEAYAMTRDPELKRAAQASVDFIVRAQDPEGGGWRYRIPQAGDTSVIGWQLMALKSAKIAGLKVPYKTIAGATDFLNSVQSEGGALYAYNRPNTVRPATTAVGLLCRMYLGWQPRHTGMLRGMKHLSDWGPNPYDIYYSYYATQAMHHWGGESWKRWNKIMRDQLVGAQSKTGDTAGSWAPDESHGVHMGGRLYVTCMSIMTLEVYYRYLPIYKRDNLSEDF